MSFISFNPGGNSGVHNENTDTLTPHPHSKNYVLLAIRKFYLNAPACDGIEFGTFLGTVLTFHRRTKPLTTSLSFLKTSFHFPRPRRGSSVSEFRVMNRPPPQDLQSSRALLLVLLLGGKIARGLEMRYDILEGKSSGPY